MTETGRPVCPRCSETVTPGSSRCAACGFAVGLLPSTRVSGAVPQGPTRKPGEQPGRVTETTRTPTASPLRPPARPESGSMCPACRTLNPLERTLCLLCGSPLVRTELTVPLRPVAPHLAPPPPQPHRRTMLVIASAAAVVLVAGGAYVATQWRRDVGSTTALPPPSTAVSPPLPTPVPTTSIRASASSTHAPDGPLTYLAANTLDGRPETAWNSDGAATGDGAGQTLTYTFATPIHLRVVTILNGYQKVTETNGARVDSFPANRRLRQVRLSTSAGVWQVDLQDVRTPQVVGEDFGVTSRLVISIRSTYPGSAFPDVAVSEVSFRAE